MYHPLGNALYVFLGWKWSQAVPRPHSLFAIVFLAENPVNISLQIARSYDLEISDGKIVIDPKISIDDHTPQ